jgi:hypothetical protein
MGYLNKTQLADESLCRIAKKHRPTLLASSEARTQRLFRFLAYVNQSDWLGKKLVSILNHMDEPKLLKELIEAAEQDFLRTNRRREKKFQEPLPDASLDAVRTIGKSTPSLLAITDATDNWVTETLKEAGRLPNDNEWFRLRTGPLDGKIGMSFALQWRYNFGRMFGMKGSDTEAVE